MPPPVPFSMKFCFYSHATKQNRDRTIRNVQYITQPFLMDDGDLEPERFNTPLHLSDRLILFDDTGEPDRRSVIAKLRQHRGLIWRMVVSLQEPYALCTGHINSSQWRKSLRGALPMIATALGIPALNFCWVAVYHPEPGHPHCHILFWENEHKRTRGKLSRLERKAVKNALIQNILANGA